MTPRTRIRSDLARAPFLVAGTADTVEAWAAQRLPSEPQGWLVDFRAALRTAVGALEPAAALSAVYSSAEDDSFGVEDVLFDNVGTSVFSTGAGAVEFERALSRPPEPPQPLDGPAIHYQHYWTGPARQGWKHWSARRQIAAWRDVPLPIPLTAARVWWSLRTSDALLLDPAAVGPRLGLVLHIGRGSASRRSLFSLMKPLVEGVVSAFHVHDGSRATDVAERLRTDLKVDQTRIKDCLVDESWALLGPRALVRPDRNGLLWDPANERLVAISVGTPDQGPSVLSGYLYEVQSRGCPAGRGT